MKKTDYEQFIFYSILSAIGIVQLVFIILKCTASIVWSWPIVLLPVECLLGLFLIISFFGIFAACILAGREDARRENNND